MQALPLQHTQQFGRPRSTKELIKGVLTRPIRNTPVTHIPLAFLLAVAILLFIRALQFQLQYASSNLNVWNASNYASDSGTLGGILDQIIPQQHGVGTFGDQQGRHRHSHQELVQVDATEVMGESAEGVEDQLSPSSHLSHSQPSEGTPSEPSGDHEAPASEAKILQRSSNAENGNGGRVIAKGQGKNRLQAQ